MHYMGIKTIVICIIAEGFDISLSIQNTNKIK